MRAGLVLLLLAPAPSAWAIYCFDFESNNQPCLQMKTQALITMMKLQNDPRFLSWTSEGQPGTKAAKDADRIMKMAQSCLTLIDCGAAAAQAQKLAGSTPGYVKGDLGDFASQIWYGADLPHGTLDQMFDNNQKTEELPFRQLADGGYQPPEDPKLPEKEATTNKPFQSAPLTFASIGAGSDAVTLGPDGTRIFGTGGAGSAASATASRNAGAKTPMPGADWALRTQANGVQYESGDGYASGSWQASGSGSVGSENSSVPYEMERRVGSAISEEPEGLTEGDAPESASTQSLKPTKLASAAISNAKKKAASDLTDAVDAAKETRSDADPLSQSDLTQMLP